MVKLHREKSYHFHVSDDKKKNKNKHTHTHTHTHTHNQTFVTHVLKKMLDTMENILIVASLETTTVLHSMNQPSISTISRLFATRLVAPSLAYSV